MIKYITIIGLILVSSTIYATDYFINPHAQNVIVRQKTVEFDADTYLGLQGYYSVVDKLQAEKLQKEELNADTLKALIEIVKILLEKQGNGGVIPNIPTVPKPEPKPEPKPTDSLDSKVFKIFNDNCKQCHNTNNASKGLKLIGTDSQGDFLYDLSLAKRVKVFDSVNGVGLAERGKKLMPLESQALSDIDVETLRLWMIAKAEKDDK